MVNEGGGKIVKLGGREEINLIKVLRRKKEGRKALLTPESNGHHSQSTGFKLTEKGKGQGSGEKGGGGKVLLTFAHDLKGRERNRS